MTTDLPAYNDIRDGDIVTLRFVAVPDACHSTLVNLFAIGEQGEPDDWRFTMNADDYNTCAISVERAS